MTHQIKLYGQQLFWCMCVIANPDGGAVLGVKSLGFRTAWSFDLELFLSSVGRAICALW